MKQDLQSQLSSKAKQINPNEPIGSLKAYLKVRPVGIRNLQLISQDLKGFQFIMSKISDKHIQEICKTFSQDECEMLLDYLHRYMQFIGQENTSSGNMLNLEEEIIRKYGPGIVIQACSRQDTIVSRTRNF